MRSVLILPALALLLSGCLVRTAANVVTAPVRAASQVVDWTTTSQDESDRNYGRRIREEERQRGREARDAEEREADEDYPEKPTARRLPPRRKLTKLIYNAANGRLFFDLDGDPARRRRC